MLISSSLGESRADAGPAHCVYDVVEWCWQEGAFDSRECWVVAKHECKGKADDHGTCLAQQDLACKQSGGRPEDCLPAARAACP